jgi:hypothetical protein
MAITGVRTLFSGTGRPRALHLVDDISKCLDLGRTRDYGSLVKNILFQIRVSIDRKTIRGQLSSEYEFIRTL